jgi:CRISPR/Cas system-associated endonuclease Cas1
VVVVIAAETNGAKMKTNYSDMAKRYELAEKLVWAKLENWQRNAITQDRTEGKNSSIFQTFSERVIHLAESVHFTAKSEVPPSQPTKKTLTPARN